MVTGRPTVIMSAVKSWIFRLSFRFPKKLSRREFLTTVFAHAFIQQEGTFWRPSLWKTAADSIGAIGLQAISISGGASQRMLNLSSAILFSAVLGFGRGS